MQVNPLDFILVVDDSASMVKIVSNIAEKLGYKNIDTAASGLEAMKKIQSTSYKLILSDWNMEPVTGIQLLRAVRQLKAGPTDANVPFILITAEVKPENIKAAVEAKVSGYVAKPFTAETLKEKIDAI